MDLSGSAQRGFGRSHIILASTKFENNGWLAEKRIFAAYTISTALAYFGKHIELVRKFSEHGTTPK